MRAIRIASALCVCLGAASAARAEVYVWQDEQGGVHMSENLLEVPPAQRARAQQAAAAGSAQSRVSRPSSPAAAAPAAPRPALPQPRAVPAAAAGAARRSPVRHVLHVERAGSEMRVVAELDGGVRVPFILDTGAMSCMLPAWAAREMRIAIDDDTPRVAVSGISGQVQWVPEVEVGSVAIGSVVVEGVEMHVLDTMDVGLLGMPFFNHFKVSTDPSAGTLTLEELDPEQMTDVIDGKNERTWRGQFAQRRAALEYVRAQLAKVPNEYVTVRERLEKQQAYWEKQLDELETKAVRAGVPSDWRQ